MLMFSRPLGLLLKYTPFGVIAGHDKADADDSDAGLDLGNSEPAVLIVINSMAPYSQYGHIILPQINLVPTLKLE